MRALTHERAIDALLDVSAPRCVWHEGRLYVNEPFASAFGITREADSSVQSSELTRHGELVEALVATSHIDIDIEQGQIAIVPIRIADDSYIIGDMRLRSSWGSVLRNVLDAVTMATEDAGALGTLCRMLVDLPGRMFETVTILRSRPFEPFLFVERYGDRRKMDRFWGRWPLHRLFLRRRPVVIQHPLLPDRALALPFLHDGVRSVILAPLAREHLAPQEDQLLTVLQSVSLVPENLGADIGPTDDPVFVWFGTDHSVRERFEGILQRRGWRLRSGERFTEFRRDMYAHAFPVLCIDAGLRNVAHALRTLRSGEGATLAIVAIGSLDMPSEEAATLVDECIPLQASDREIIGTLKNALRRSNTARIREFQTDLEGAKALIRSAKSVEDLAAEAARASALLIDGWANVQLMDPSGVISLGEYPVSMRPVASDIPNFFLDATPLAKTAVDDEFFEYASSDEAARWRMRALDFKSGVCVPLNDGQRIAGTLIAASTAVRRDEGELKGVISLSEEIVAQLRRIRERPAIPEFHREKSWTYLRDTTTEVHVYRSADATVAARFFRIDAAFSVLVIAEPRDHEAILSALREIDLPGCEPAVVLARLTNARLDGKFLVATLDRATRSLGFAARGVSPPVLWNAPGPHGELASVAGAYIGTFSLERSRAAYFSDMELMPYAHRPLGQIREQLERTGPTGIFAAVVMQSLGAG